MPRLLTAVEFGDVDTLSSYQISGYSNLHHIKNHHVLPYLSQCTLTISYPFCPAAKMAAQSQMSIRIRNPYFDQETTQESYIYIYGTNTVITSPNITVLSITNVPATTSHPTSNSATACNLSVVYRIQPKGARAEVRQTRTQLQTSSVLTYHRSMTAGPILPRVITANTIHSGLRLSKNTRAR